MSAFIESSKTEREKMTKLFKQYNVNTYSFTSDTSHLRHDGEYKTNKYDVVFEVKVRNISSKSYKTTVIEESKYNYLIDYAYRNGKEPYIFIFFNDGKVLIQNLNTVAHRIKNYQAPKTTAGDQTKVNKTFFEVEITNKNLHKCI